MIKYILIAVLIFVTPASADNFIVGFRGMNDQFDHKAFQEFAKMKNLTPIEFGAYEIDRAFKFINSKTEDYELYGFSLGSWSVKQVLTLQHMNGKRMPKHITTVGAYNTVNVNFTEYGISFSNYFDNSGKKNKSPGVYINVPHNKIMEHVNTLIK